MTSALRRAAATAGAAALVAVLSPVTSAQAPPPPPGQPTSVVYQPPTPGQGQVVTTSNVTISALVASLSTLPEQKLYVIVSGPVNITREVTATSTCQEVRVQVSLPKNGDYQVTVRADAPAPVGVEKCMEATVEPRQFRVEVPPKPAGGSGNASPPGAGPAASAGGAGAGGARSKRGSYSASGSSKSVFGGPPQARARAGGAAAAGEEGFDERLPYTGAEEEEPRELGAEETSNSSHRSLAFIAGGFLVLAVYMHLWWLKRQAEQPVAT